MTKRQIAHLQGMQSSFINVRRPIAALWGAWGTSAGGGGGGLPGRGRDACSLWLRLLTLVGQ